jgi:hypothetical protein
MRYKTPLAPEIESERAYVVYDMRTGRIVHVHRATTYCGAEARSVSADEARARELAVRFGHCPDGLRVLAVAPRDLDLSVPKRIDLKTLRLIPIGVRTKKGTSGAMGSVSKARRTKR